MISKTELAKQLKVSRSSVSRSLNHPFERTSKQMTEMVHSVYYLENKICSIVTSELFAEMMEGTLKYSKGKNGNAMKKEAVTLLQLRLMKLEKDKQ